VDIDKPIVICDVGCRWGFADKFLKNLDYLRIYGFDPDVEECKLLEEKYNNDHIKIFPLALSDKESSDNILYLTKESACSSLYKPDVYLTEAYPGLECAKEISVQKVTTSTLDIWSKCNEVDYIDYVKIDVQGAELKVLKGAEKILKTVRFLELEVEFNPIYQNQPIFSELDIYLREQGFVLWKFTNLVHYGLAGENQILGSINTVNYDDYRIEFESRGGQLYWADAIYIRKEIASFLYYNLNENLLRDIEIAKLFRII